MADPEPPAVDPSTRGEPIGHGRRALLRGLGATVAAAAVGVPVVALRSCDDADESPTTPSATEALTETLYVTDRSNSIIRSVSVEGVVTTIAGTTMGRRDGTPEVAQFNLPFGIAAGPNGVLYVADQGNDLIRTIDADHMVSTLAGSTYGFADGPRDAARFQLPYGLALTESGTLLVADSLNHRIRAVTPEGHVTTIAGGTESGHVDGAAHTARFDEPTGVVIDPTGTIYVADRSNHRIRSIDPDGTVSTLAGTSAAGAEDGPPGVGRLNRPTGIARHPDGRLVLVETGGHRVRSIDEEGTITTIAGSGDPGFADGRGDEARFHEPCGIAIGADGTIYVADRMNHRVRAVAPDGQVTTLAGGEAGRADGSGSDARFDLPYGLAIA